MSNTIDVSPIITIIQPIIQIIVEALIGIAVTWFAARAHQWTGRNMADGDKAALENALDTAAGVIFANASAGISAASIHVGDPVVAAQVNRVINTLPKLVAATGATPDSIAHDIVGKLGDLQSRSPTPSSGLTIAPPAGSTTLVQGDAAVVKPTAGSTTTTTTTEQK